MRRWTTIVAGSVLVGMIAACGDGYSGGSSADGDSGTAQAPLTVYAAASLKSTFEEIGAEFESEYASVTVEFSFAGSSDLVSQIHSGAPADVFASADEANMAKLASDGLTGSQPAVFATNTLMIAVPPDNPADVASLQDLTDPGINLVICAPQVPCGSAAQKVAAAAGITFQPVSEEQSVTDVLAKVTSGEADAGLVYVTDVKVAGDSVEGIEFPESGAAVNRYPIATLADTENPDLAEQFVDFVRGEQGRQILADAGFGVPAM